MNIGIDIDDVLAEFASEILPFYNKKYGTSLSIDDIYTYDLSKIFHIDRQRVVERVYEFYKSKEFEHILPSKGAQDVLKVLKKQHTLFVITSRPDFITKITGNWINHYFPHTIEKILHSNQFSIESEKMIKKSQLCKQHNISVLIEDAPEYAKDAAENGISVILLDKPWNRTVKNSPFIRRALQWNSIPKMISEITPSTSP